jgi:hypothetical protein
MMRFRTGELPNDNLDGLLHGLAERLRREQSINQAIADADPLGVDESIHILPELNEHKNIEGVRNALEQALVKAQHKSKFDFIHTSAAIRDIGMFAGSFVSYGIEPADCVRGFSETLMHLSSSIVAKTPRDSFIDYTCRNPVGIRERRFTRLLEEEIFIYSLRQGMYALDSCLKSVMQAYSQPLSSKKFAEYFRSATDSFQILIDLIVRIRRDIASEVFAHDIRPYFDPFRVGDTEYSAPSGAEMSVLNIDQVIWGADCDDQLYTTYFQANIIRLPAVYQEISQTFARQKSLMTRVKERVVSGSPLSFDERNSIQELHHLITKMYSFRMLHYKVAEENIKLRLQEAQGGKEVKGSSGFGLVEAKFMLDNTIKSRQITAQALHLH